MWVTRKQRAPRVHFRRFIILLALSFLMPAFTTVGPLAREAFAADAIWKGTELTYNGSVYTKVTAPPDRTDTPNEYEWRSGSGNSLMANVLYFGPDNPAQAR